jgi:hypothetical protein
LPYSRRAGAANRVFAEYSKRVRAPGGIDNLYLRLKRRIGGEPAAEL